MEIPKEIVRSPPPATLSWVARQFGPRAAVVRVRRLRNAWAAAMHAIDVVDGDVETECAALTLLAWFEGVPVPRLLAADAAAGHTDVPAVLMTRLDGNGTLDPIDVDAWVDGLVQTLHRIHAVTRSLDTLAPYRPWRRTFGAAPAWTSRPRAWERAISLAHGPLPAVETVLCHRDYWPGNVLWHGREVSGVVDWTHACRGPAAVDVAHCRRNLAILYGLDVADDFADRYGPVPELATFDVLEAVTCGLEPTDVWRWHDAGRTDLTFEVMAARVDEYVAAAVRQLA
jgi:aminoglycoside phosphotransferase (APT) family kinase protein